MTDATDAELIARLRGGGVKRLGYMGVELHDTAADRIEALAARVAVLEAEVTAIKIDALLQAAAVCQRNADAIREAMAAFPSAEKRHVLEGRAAQSQTDAAAIRALATP